MARATKSTVDTVIDEKLRVHEQLNFPNQAHVKRDYVTSFRWPTCTYVRGLYCGKKPVLLAAVAQVLSGLLATKRVLRATGGPATRCGARCRSEPSHGGTMSAAELFSCRVCQPRDDWRVNGAGAGGRAVHREEI